MDPIRSAPNVSQSPTITTLPISQAGMILGTAAYMSPEQAKGRAVDKRSDVCIVAPDQFVVHPLQQGRHRLYLL